MAQAVRVMVICFSAGLILMALRFLIEKVSKGTELYASVGYGFAVLVVAAYILIAVIADETAVAFLVPPPLI